MRYKDINSKTDEHQFVLHLLKENKISTTEFAVMMEAIHCFEKRLLTENVKQDNVDFFQTNSGVTPIVGRDYWIIPVQCTMDFVQIYDSSFDSPSESSIANKRKLIRVSNSQYEIEVNGKIIKFPNNVLRPMSFLTVLFFDDHVKYNEVATAISLRFDIELPRLPDMSADITEALNRRDFLKGAGAAAGLGTLAYGAYQQKQRPMTDPGSSYSREPANRLTSAQNSGDMATTQPQQQALPAAPTKPERVIPKYSPQQLEQYLIDYVSKYLPVDQCIQFMAQAKTETHDFRSLAEYDAPGHSKYSGGAKYKGRGYLQITHDHNYEKYGRMVGQDLVNDPDLLLFPNIAAQVSLVFWKDYAWPTSQRLMRKFQRQFPNITKAVTKAVNGGYKKLDERQKNVIYYTNYFKQKQLAKKKSK